MEQSFWLDSLRARGGRLSEEYCSAEPFPHAVVDQFLAEDTARAVSREFFEEPWERADDYYQRRRWSKGWDPLGPATKGLVELLHSEPFTGFLSDLTGIPSLSGDATLGGGCLHEIRREGYWAIHRDFNKLNHRDRRVLLLLDLTENWDETWGGNLEFWDRTVTRRVRAIAPAYNRLVVWNLEERSYYGMPVPLRCPPGAARRALMLYYYSRGVREDRVSDRFKYEYVDTEWKVPRRAVKFQ